MNRLRLRQVVLAVSLIASAGAALWVQGSEDDGAIVATAVPRERSSPGAAEAEAPRLALERLNQRPAMPSDIDPFRARSWYVPPPAPPPPPPPKPTAPPLPFQYMGKTEDIDGGNMMVFLAKGNQSFTVKPGEKFDGAYQLEGIDKGSLVIVYLPLSVTQRLSIGPD